MMTITYIRSPSHLTKDETFDAHNIHKISEITFDDKVVKIFAWGKSAIIVGFLLNRPVGEFVRVFGEDAVYCCTNWEFGYEKITRDLDTK